MDTNVMATTGKTRGVLNVSENLRDAFTAWCKANDDVKVKSVTERLVTWFLFQEEPVLTFVLKGISAYPDGMKEENVRAISEMVIKRALEIPQVLGGEIAKDVVDPAVEKIAGGKSAAPGSRGPKSRRKTGT